MSEKRNEAKKLTKREKINLRRDNTEKKEITTKKPKTALKKEKNIIKYLKTILFVAVLIIVFYPPYLKGLYFEDQQLPAEIFVFTIFAVFWVYKIIKRDKRFFETPIDYASFGFVIVYLISILGAVSLRPAIAEWLKYCMYFAVFFMLSELADNHKSRVTVLWVIVASAAGVAILGIDAVAGGHIAAVLKPVLTGIGAPASMFMDLYKDGRIYSTVQYPNTLAAYLMAAFFISLGLTITSSKLWSRLTAGAASFILLITFIATLSRGAYILLPIAAIIFLISLPGGNRIKGAIYGIGMAIAAGLVSIKLSGYILKPEGNEMKIWAYLFAGLALSVLFTVLINNTIKWLERINWKVYIGITAGAAALLIAATIYLFNASVPLELGHTINEDDSRLTHIKSMVLGSNKEYKLVYDVNASMAAEKDNAYTVTIYSRDKKNILFDGSTTLASFEDKSTNGIKEREVAFKVPEGSTIVDFYFQNTYQGTSAVFDNARVTDAETGKTVKNIILKYRYLPESITSRIENLQVSKSTLSRSIFYQDGLSIFKDHWLLGAGGGAWKFLYFSHQSYLYWTTQAHNFPLQLGVETGIIGVIVLIILLLSLLLTYIRYYQKKKKEDEAEESTEEGILAAAVVTAIAALLMHSAIDFDFSLSAVFLLLWELIAVLNSIYKVKANEYILFNPGIKKQRSEINSKRPIIKYKALKVSPKIGFIGALAILLIPILFISATSYAIKVSKAWETKKIDVAIQYLNMASALDPFRPEYKIDYANLLIRKSEVSKEDVDEANKRMSKAESLCKYDFNLIPQIGSYYLSLGNVEKGLELCKRITMLRPFNPTDWQRRVSAYFNVIGLYFDKKDVTNGIKYIDEALSVVDEAKKANEKNMDPFIFNVETDEMLEKLKYVKDNIDSGEKIDINKMIFYSMPEMDIDFDAVPDQWITNSTNEVNIRDIEEKLIVESSNIDNWNYIQSRELKLETSKIYRIEVEFEEIPNTKTIPYDLIGVFKNLGELIPEQSGKVYVSEINTPDDAKLDKSVFRLFIKDNKYEINKISIIEK